MKNIKFIIIAFVAVILLPSISFGSIYYFKKHNVAPQPIIQTPEVKPDIVTETPKTEETKTEPVKETPTPTPVKTPVKETPKVETPVEPVKVVCDSAKKAELINQYGSDTTDAWKKWNSKYADALSAYNTEIAGVDGKCSDIWDPQARQSCRSRYLDMAGQTLKDSRGIADTEYNGHTAGLATMLKVNLQSINCSN